ncbi:MAG: Lacal_2735 family protein [Flavobacteriales bacterium]|nr:Lacal_2735 family protein [Flavobacteriales bacterium]
MNFFKRKTKKEKLMKEYEKKLAKAHKMAPISRQKSDELIYEAEQLIKQMENEN